MFPLLGLDGSYDAVSTRSLPATIIGLYGFGKKMIPVGNSHIPVDAGDDGR